MLGDCQAVAMRMIVITVDSKESYRTDVEMFVSNTTDNVTVVVNNSVFGKIINNVVFPHPTPPCVMLIVKAMVIVTKVR